MKNAKLIAMAILSTFLFLLVCCSSIFADQDDGVKYY